MSDNLLYVGRQVESLTVTSEQRAANEEAHMWGWGKPSVTCPPSTNVNFQAGWFYTGGTGDSGSGWWSNPLTAEFAAGGNCEVSGFDNPGYYRGIVVSHVYRSLSTVEGAESDSVAGAIETVVSDNLEYNDAIPLVVVIVKNNEITGVAGAILPVDGANRGRSFLYRRVRPWLHTHAGGHS